MPFVGSQTPGLHGDFVDIFCFHINWGPWSSSDSLGGPRLDLYSPLARIPDGASAVRNLRRTGGGIDHRKLDSNWVPKIAGPLALHHFFLSLRFYFWLRGFCLEVSILMKTCHGGKQNSLKRIGMIWISGVTQRRPTKKSGVFANTFIVTVLGVDLILLMVQKSHCFLKKCRLTLTTWGHQLSFYQLLP